MYFMYVTIHYSNLMIFANWLSLEYWLFCLNKCFFFLMMLSVSFVYMSCVIMFR